MSAVAISEFFERKELAPRQRVCLDFIRNYIASHGYSPSIREIAFGMGIRSNNGVNDHLRALQRKGYIDRLVTVGKGTGRARTVTLSSGPSVPDIRADMIEVGLSAVAKELRRAKDAYPQAFNSLHEGYAVLREEVDELWDEVKRREPDRLRIRDEAVQVAAMALRIIAELT